MMVQLRMTTRDSNISYYSWPTLVFRCHRMQIDGSNTELCNITWFNVHKKCITDPCCSNCHWNSRYTFQHNECNCLCMISNTWDIKTVVLHTCFVINTKHSFEKITNFVTLTDVSYSHQPGTDWLIEQGLTSPPTQYRLSGSQFHSQVKRPNQLVD